MKPALQLRLHQQLALTPQLQQAIKLLQLSSIELEIELRNVLESNPLLELTERDGEDTSDYDGAETPAETAEPADAEPVVDNETQASDDFELAGDFEDDGKDYGSPRSGDSDDRESQEPEVEDLRDHLLWQLNLTPLSPRDRAIGTTIIEAIDDDGYLHEDSQTLQGALADIHVGASGRGRGDAPSHPAIRPARRCQPQSWRMPGSPARRVRCVHPGLEGGARDRLRAPGNPRPQRPRAPGQAGQCRCRGNRRGDRAAALARSATRGAIQREHTRIRRPDAYARRQNGRWTVALSSHCQPRLTISKHYSDLITRAQRDDAHYLRGQLQEARWLIKSLATRADTMLKVATAIVRTQTAFLDFGPEAMRPLVLRDIAEQIGMHESTVSRMTTRKYLHTPRGTFEFKYFFSSGVGTIDGGAASSTAIQAMIRKLIDDETPRKPLSDQALTIELNRRGIEVARRTVAKYREGMNIPSSNERSRLC